MTRIVAKLLLVDSCNNPETLLVGVLDDKRIQYRFYGSVSRVEYSIGNLQTKEALPDLMLDYDTIEEMVAVVKKCIKGGTSDLLETYLYTHQRG